MQREGQGKGEGQGQGGTRKSKKNRNSNDIQKAGKSSEHTLKSVNVLDNDTDIWTDTVGNCINMSIEHQ